MLRDDIRFAKKLIADGCIGEIMKVHTNVCHGGPEYFQYRTADPTWFHRPGSGALYLSLIHILMNLAMRVYSGELTDSDEARSHYFTLSLASVAPYLRMKDRRDAI